MTLHASIDASLDRARRAALKHRDPEGFWEGELELNPAPSAQFILLGCLLSDGDRWLTADRARGAARYLLRLLNADGSLSPYAGEPGHRSLTLEAALALQLVDWRWGWTDAFEAQQARDALTRARDFLKSAAETARTQPLFRSTEMFLALLGLLPWTHVPKLPLELLLAPDHLGIELTAYWIRTVSVPMALLGSLSRREVEARMPPETPRLREEYSQFLAAERRPGVLAGIMRRLGGITSEIPRPSLLRAAAENRIASFTESNGDIGGNPYAAFFCALYWDRLPQPSSEQRVRKQRALDALLDYAIEGPPPQGQHARPALSQHARPAPSQQPEWRLQTNLSTIWDTAFFLCAFREGDPRLQPSTRWLASQQIRDVRGDWCRNIDAEPAGFSFGRGHDHYPVTDCTAVALLALRNSIGPEFVTSPEALAAARFLLAFQADDGGFAPYEKPTLSNPERWNRLIPFQDIPSEIFDRTKADVTGKVCEALALFSKGPLAAEIRTSLERAREFLLATRDSDGLWNGNYGVNRLYGTTFAIRGLRAIDRALAQASGTESSQSRDWQEPAGHFFLSMQNEDGGWGETESGSRCDSSSLQTAWAVLGLCACPDSGDKPEIAAAVQKGVEHLLCNQDEKTGFWKEPRHLGMVFPGTVNFRYEYYPAYFPMMALEEARKGLAHSQS